MSISRNPNWKHIFTSDLGQVGGFCSGTPFYSIKKTDCLDITEILLKVALNTTTFILTPRPQISYGCYLFMKIL
jgi:hypothetical protein